MFTDTAFDIGCHIFSLRKTKGKHTHTHAMYKKNEIPDTEVCTCVHTWTHTHPHTCAHANTHTQKRNKILNTSVSPCMHTCAHTHKKEKKYLKLQSAHTHACTQKNEIHERMTLQSTCTHTCMHVRAHTNTHTNKMKYLTLQSTIFILPELL